MSALMDLMKPGKVSTKSSQMGNNPKTVYWEKKKENNFYK